jgi:hypothetical protein
MPTSKLLLLTFLSLNLLGLAACNIPAPQSRDSEGTSVATFFVTEPKGDALTATLSKDFAIPESRTFNFTACVKDQAQSKPLVGHPFRIEDISKELKSDETGCLNWSEKVPFNFFSKPKYLDWKRQITATGLHKGTRTVRFAINPWSDNDKSQAVVNLETVTPPQLVTDSEKIKEVLRGSPGGSSVSKNSLWVNDMRIQSNEQKFTQDGVILSLELMAIPQLHVSAMNGEKMLRPLSQGHFKTRLYLIHTVVEGDKEIRRILAQSVPKTVAVRGGNLFIKSALKLTSIPTRGQLVLGLDISADDRDENIGNFHGVYMMGDYDQLKSAGFLKLMSIVTELKDFKISAFINSKLDEKFSDSSDDKDAYVKPRIEIAPLEFKYVRVGKESTSDREIIYNVKACLKNGLEQKITRGYTFSVSGFRQTAVETGKIVKIKTDNSSCINWDETLTFKYYECQKYFNGFVEIENKDLALKQKIEVAINPWESWGTFARDLRYVDSKERLLTDCKKENVLPSTVSLKSISYSTLSYNYEIDSLLNLTFKKKLRFKLDAAVSIFSDMARGRMESSQKLRPGVYLLKLALIKNRDYYNQKTYVSSVEKLVATLDGDIKTDIEFKTADLKALGDRNTLLVELDPVKEDKVTVDQGGNVALKEKVNSLEDIIDHNTGLVSRTFSAAMILNTDKDAQELIALDPKDANQYLVSDNLPKLDETHKSVIREYIKFGEKLAIENLQVQKAQADIGLFAKTNSLKHVSAKDTKGSEDFRRTLASPPTRMNEVQIQKELNDFATTGKISTVLGKGLCGYWFKNFIAKELWDTYAMLSLVNCDRRTDKPERLFTVEKRLFVNEIGDYRFVKGFNAAVTEGNNITLTKSQTHSNSVTKSLTFNMGLSHKFADIFSIGVSGNYAISQSDINSESAANSTSVNTNISLLMQQNIYQLNIKRYQECSIVKIQLKHFMRGELFASALSPKLKGGEKADVASRGLMICTGIDRTTPIVRNENYYLLAQDATATQMQDNGDARNRNFFIALRGEKEFQRLMYFMKGSIKTPQTADSSNDEQKNIFTNLDLLLNSGSANVPGSYNDTH